MNRRYDENEWLEELVDTIVTVYLANGTKLMGPLLGYTANALFLGPKCGDVDGVQQMIYKGVISTVQPASSRSCERHHTRSRGHVAA